VWQAAACEDQLARLDCDFPVPQMKDQRAVEDVERLVKGV
jgi:hypothetical protein